MIQSSTPLAWNVIGLTLIVVAMTAMLFRGSRATSAQGRGPARWLTVPKVLLLVGGLLGALSGSSVGPAVGLAAWVGLGILAFSSGIGVLVARAFPKDSNGEVRHRRTIEMRRSEVLSALQNRGCLHGLALAHRSGPEEPKGMVEAVAMGNESDISLNGSGSRGGGAVGRMSSATKIHPEVESLAAEEARLARDLAVLGRLEGAFTLWLRFHTATAAVFTVFLLMILLRLLTFPGL